MLLRVWDCYQTEMAGMKLSSKDNMKSAERIGLA